MGYTMYKIALEDGKLPGVTEENIGSPKLPYSGKFKAASGGFEVKIVQLKAALILTLHPSPLPLSGRKINQPLKK
jgi:hypothetical protein